MSGAGSRVERRLIGVVAEWQAVDNAWVDHRWRVTAILDGVPDLAAWACIEASPHRRSYYAGAAELALYPRETDTLRHNLASAAPSVYVFLRATAQAPGMELLGATVCVGEAHAHADTGCDLVEAVAMPPGIAAWTAAFVGTAPCRAGAVPPQARGSGGRRAAAARVVSGFLSRWARRKAEGRKAEAASAETDAAAATAAPASVIDEAQLPPLETLTGESDFTAFLAAGVSQGVQSRALRVAWEADPAIASFRGMAEYDWDFNAAGYGRLAATDNVAALLDRVMGVIDKVTTPGVTTPRPVAEALPAESSLRVSVAPAEEVAEIKTDTVSGSTPAPPVRRHGGALPT